MRFYFAKIGIVVTLLLTVSCSGYNKLIKSGTNRQKYDKGIEYYHAKKYNKALELFKDVAPVYSLTEQADTLAFYCGLCLFKMGDFESSAEQFDGFRRKFTRSPFLEEAEYYFAKGFYYLSPGPENDQTYTYRALQAINEYLDRYPKSQKREGLLECMIELRQKLYDKTYFNARLYYDVGYYNSAVTALKNAIIQQPESNHREELSYLIVNAQCLFARHSISKLQRQRYLDTQNAYYSFIDEYPESKYRKEVDKMQQEAKKYLEKYKDLSTENATMEDTALDESTFSNDIASQTGAQEKVKSEKEKKEKPKKEDLVRAEKPIIMPVDKTVKPKKLLKKSSDMETPEVK